MLFLDAVSCWNRLKNKNKHLLKFLEIEADEDKTAVILVVYK